MNKKNRNVMKVIAAALAVVVAATAVLHNDEMLMARETFTGLQTMLANNQQLTVVEIVDDFSESSLGYLFGGVEPYNVEEAKRNGTMDDLIEELLTKGLLTTGDTDDWNSYPLRYEVVDTMYSDYADDQDILQNADYRQQGDEAATLSGYYLPIEISGDERAFYRCKTDDYEKMKVMTPYQLRKAAETIKDSYAPLLSNGYPDGYPAESGYQYFQFVVGNPKDVVTAQDDADRSASVGAVTAGTVTAEASKENAAPTPEQMEDGTDENTEPADETENPDEEQSGTQQEGGGMMQPSDTEQAGGEVTQPSDTESSDDHAVQSGDHMTMAPNGGNGTSPSDGSGSSAPSNGSTPMPGANAAPSVDGNAEKQQGSENASSQSGGDVAAQDVQTDGARITGEGTDSASAAIYVEFDENHSVLVASLGNAGVEGVFSDAQNENKEQSSAAAPTQGGATAGISNGAIPTVTPAPTPSAAASADQGSGSSTPTPSTGGSSESDSSAGQTGSNGSDGDKNNGGNADGGAAGGDNENNGSHAGNGNTSSTDTDKTDGGDDKTDGDNADGGNKTDGDNADGDDDENPDDDEDLDNENEDDELNNGEEDQAEYQVTYGWEGLDQEKGDFTEPSLPEGGTVAEGEEITIPENPESIEVNNPDGEKIGTYTFDGWMAGATDAGIDTYASVNAGDIVSVNEDMTVIGTWSYQEGACYTITYEWNLIAEEDGSLPDGVTADSIVLKRQMQTLDLSSQPEITLPPPETVAEGTTYHVNDDFAADEVYDVYDKDGNYIGTCTFGGWKDSDGADCDEISVQGDVSLFGELSFRAAGTVNYQFEYPWGSDCLSEDGLSLKEGTALQGFTSDEKDRAITITLTDGGSLNKEMKLPDPMTVSGGGCRVDGTYYGAEIEVTEKRTINNGEIHIPVGKLLFSGWKEPGSADAIEPGEDYEFTGAEVTLTGTWEFISSYSDPCTVGYEWGILEANEDDGSISSDRYHFGGTVDGNGEKLILPSGYTLPSETVLSNGGYLERNPELPNEGYNWYQGMKYTPDSAYTEGMKIAVYETVDGNEELVGTYVFLGWELHVGSDDARMLTSAELQNGFELKGNTTLRGVWDYEPEASADVIAGSGCAYVYVNDTIHNNDWFRYYVMGLEEKDYGKVNIRVVTYLADGSDKRAYGYKAEEDCPTLTEAIKKADLVYLNTNGLWMDDEGNTQSSSRRLSTEHAKALLERACNVDRSARLAVILDNSVQSNQVDENVQKVTALLCQEDIAEAYASLSEDGMSYEKSFSSDEWQKLNACAVIRNGGNFVHDNVYCVSHQRGEFGNTTYPGGETVVRPGSMPALANADFENRFTDSVTDAGFAEVYQAIQKENYERSRNGVQASLDEYVMPATAVAYILNYRDYDPIIYKDKIRVLELEPCRDYTYYYDGQSGTTELELKKKFASDWAQDFLTKLESDPDAITIDGMTTSEFCGKILDIYEEYDVIYFGANDGILNRNRESAGFQWVKVDAYDGTIGADNPYQPIAWESNRYTYHDGNWYAVVDTGEKKWVRVDTPIYDYVDDTYTWDGTRNWQWKASEKRWYIKTAETNWEWVPSDKAYTDKNIDVWQNNRHFNYDVRVQAWREERSVYTEGEIRPDGPTQSSTNWFDGGSAETSSWMWKGAYSEWGENVKITSSASQMLYDRGWYHKVWFEEISYTNYALWGNTSDLDKDMNGMLYTHVGGRMGRYHVMGREGHLAANEADYGFRSSGNDILQSQVEELLHYLDGGSLVILAPEFMTENAAGGQIINSSDVVYHTGNASYRGILDTSSYIYQFVRQCFERKTDGTDVPRYSNLIVEDFGNGSSGDVKDTEAFIEALNQQKVTLNLYSAPEAYRYDTVDADYGRIDEDTRTMLQKASDGKYYLNYEFIIGNLSAVAPLTTRYHVQLFLDSNSDGIYNTASEELTDITVINAQTGAVMERQGGRYQLQMNVPYRVVRELPDGYVGCIGWKLMVSQNGNAHIHDSVAGLTAVPVQPGYSDEVNPETGKKVIHVLQITPAIWGNEMDLEVQTNEEHRGGEWYQLLMNLPDFEIDFDSIYYWDFAHSFLQPGESGYDPQYDNGGVDGKLTGAYGRSDYLNFYQYDMVIIGFQDSIPSIPSQRAIDALLRYGDMGKSMLFTHDTTYNEFSTAPDDFASGALGQPLSMSIRDLCGMDRFGVSVDWYETDANGVKHSNVAASPIRNTGSAAVAYNASSSAYQWYASHPGGTSRDVAYAPGTNQTMMAAHTQGTTWVFTGTNSATCMFDYASHGFDPLSCGHNMNRDTSNPDKTCEVSQVNSGIITQYPYDIPENIRVADTHGQYYQLDLDTDWDGDGRGDVVCWYCISSLDNGDWNDIYDFSPNDVRNNYYIYNKGNITYSGVGHDTQHITLDEKKLFINTFVAAYNAGIRNPSVRIVEDGSVNAPDLENVSIPFNGVDEATAGTYRVYYQVKDNNITQGTRNLSVKYYIGNPAGSDTVVYRTEAGSQTIAADLLANSVAEGDGGLITYSADTGEPVRYDQVRSGFSYYVDVPLGRLLDNEKFDFYVEVDLTMADDPDRVAAFDVDKLTIAKLKMFSLD